MVLLRNGKFVLINNTFAFPPTADPCTEVDCSGNPSIKLTIFDADYAGGPITWCGETWTQQEVKDGVTKCVCPTTYSLITHPTPTNTTVYTFVREERWVHLDSLVLQREFFKNSVPSPGYYYLYRDLDVQLKTAGAVIFVDNRDYTAHFSNYIFSFSNNATTATLGIFNPANNAFLPTKNNYRILDDQFGSVIKSGIEYTHAKGDDW